MLYLATASGDAVRGAMRAGHIGGLVTPDSRNTPEPGVPWAADNGCFAARWTEAKWWRWLQRQPRDGCLFAVAPDVVGDAAATLERATPWLPRIRALGFPVAYVAQNGQQHLPVPWDSLDWLFLGGSAECELCGYVRPTDAPRLARGHKPRCPHCGRVATEWKLSRHATELAREAKARGKRVHMGRVNSGKRWAAALHMGCDTVDGTFLAVAPTENLGRLLRWFDQPAALL